MATSKDDTIKSNLPPSVLKINKKTDHFFISISKQQGVHSFLMLGTYDPQGHKIQRLLSRVGKGHNLTKPNFLTNMQCICNGLFFSNPASLRDEWIYREKIGLHPISYQAYDITYEQYIEFVRILESLQTDENKFACYKPVGTAGPVESEQEGQCAEKPIENQDKIKLRFTEDKVFPSRDVRQIQESVSELDLGNTCRHSAIKLVEEVQHAPVGSLVSSSFFRELPYQTILEYGKPSQDIPFYVLPPPPAAFVLGDEGDGAKEMILGKLYSRMEALPCLEPDSEDTQIKFSKLKELYLDLVGPKKDLTLDLLIENIQDWKVKNKPQLEVLRKTYFWDYLPFVKRTSSTMKLLDEIENDLKSGPTNQLHG
ncbi:hypothetical protein OQJ13_02515 [Legionella sp. PATHC035]|uniref:hypothetical protein n=1 Tax=Legionella sp. PATHC035 TaxID=2992040 RepID=UPI002244AFE5|nr:hypothetical protein [Legionella sp. PATHC035]MCW8407841.1 hypothetical protein [Legionella sp. PATHC035]